MNCSNCGAPTKVWGTEWTKYCSRACHHEYYLITRRANYEPKACAICGNVFTPISSANKYCSKPCKRIADRDAASKKPKLKKCRMCGADFEPYTSLDKYCGYECRRESIKVGRSRRWSEEATAKRLGENNPAYVHGQTQYWKKRSSAGLRQFQKNGKEYVAEMIERDGHAHCEMCGTSSGRMEKHHIVYRSEKPGHPNLHDKINILLVCVKCHNDLHSNKWKRNKIVEDRGLAAFFGDDILNK